MEVKPGYKQTEVGLIPDDWRLASLGRLISSVEYGSSAKSNPKGKVPVLRMGNLQGGKIDWDDLVYTDDDAEIRKYRLRSGDVLFNRTNTIDLVGKTAIYEGQRAAIFAGYLIRINVDESALDSRFLNYILNTEFARRHSAKVLSVAVGQANINAQKLKTYPIPLPPTLAEQEAIAEALRDADALTESLEQLVAKKRHLKQAAMQQLLTGKLRVNGKRGTGSDNGLPSNWRIVPICDVAKLESGHTPSRREPAYWDGSIPWVSLHDSKNLNVKEIHRTELTVSELGLANSSARLLPKGTVIFSRTATIGKSTVLGRPMATSQDFANYICGPQLHNHFLVALFRGMQDVWRSLMAGSTLNTVYMPAFKALKITLPPLDEQLAIAEMHSDMETEIEAIESKLAKALQIKQGMMQELLTGRTRLVAPRSGTEGKP